MIERTLKDQIDQAAKNGIATFRKQVVTAGLRGPELAAFDFKMGEFRRRFVEKSAARFEALANDIGRDMMAELETEFGKIVRH
ncbi:MAG: hypothetical protein EPN31_12125 [Castellaniella sp.]|uniref:hypothetical protein n=1 Tax=Castellaniella sp. TaxID=1955812 RepID=UPI001201D6C8|nr:hypothetical protein [Castellaniella sp.]TAN27275.1 MAG: hypothetical protein EPN31_12125 [Castellaniella sp.]